MAITLSDLFGKWAEAAGVAKDKAHSIVDNAVTAFPDLKGQQDKVQTAIETGFLNAGLDPTAALALAIKAIGEIRGGTAGVDPQAFGSAT